MTDTSVADPARPAPAGPPSPTTDGVPGGRLDTAPSPAAPTVRRLRFECPEELTVDWTPQQPELASVANAVSLLMPHAEPYVVRSVRAVVEQLPGPLRAEAEAWAAQETAHHGAHTRFNRALIAQRPSLRRVDRWAASTFSWLGRRSTRLGVAYAAGFETLAFMAARWVDRRASTLFRGADPAAATLFLWHLAEEVEHKTVAHDVHRATGGRRGSFALGLGVAMVVMAWFTVLGTLTGMAASGRLWRPSAHWRMTCWSFGFLFELLPALAGTLLRGHHPSDLADPYWLPVWLQSYDPATRTMPEWSMDVTSP